MKIFRIGCLFIPITIFYLSCTVPKAVQSTSIKPAPATFANQTDSTNSALIQWHQFFNDTCLVALIDTALKNNVDIGIALQNIEIAKSNVLIRKSALLPNINIGGGAGVEKVGRYTSQGAGDASTEITPGKEVPDNLTDFNFSLQTSWELDVWGKLHTAKKAALAQYLATVEGKNFVVTNLVAEVANTYYELLGLDNQLAIIKEAIQLQKNELEVLKVQKEAAVVTELAVKQFEAQVYNAESQAFEVQQNITVAENKLNFLLGRYPQSITRATANFMNQIPTLVNEGVPAQLLNNRPDIRQAALELKATQFELQVAKLEFYPSVNITAALGLQAFKPRYLTKLPASVLYNFGTDVAAPIINRNALKAAFSTANAVQIQAMYEYQKQILNGFVEVKNELSNINNLQQQFEFKTKEVNTLTQSITIASELFKYAKANYLEVLTVQRDAMAAKMELIAVKKEQLKAVTNLYKALGGGWQ
ncbi:TolC family protein [Ferruginibacter yonginensis]|uniref:TolC family protein n=1 Tax=Ferruginibacter yonginensis TaxID=1310416 RepID=A0ABV8QVT9_9BACT